MVAMSVSGRLRRSLVNDQPGTGAAYGVQINGWISNQFQHDGCDVQQLFMVLTL